MATPNLYHTDFNDKEVGNRKIGFYWCPCPLAGRENKGGHWWKLYPDQYVGSDPPEKTRCLIHDKILTINHVFIPET